MSVTGVRGLKENKVISIEDRIPKLKEQRKKKANRRLIFLLLLFFSLIAIIGYFQSPLSYVSSITVQNNIVYDTDFIISESAITLDDNIWSLEKDKIVQKLKELPQIKSAEIIIKFPNHILINISEFRKIGYVYTNGNYIPVLENGKLLQEEQVDSVHSHAPILFSFQEGTILDEMIKELEVIDEYVLNSISEIHSNPKASDQLAISVFMNDGNEVLATIRNFAEKIKYYPEIVSQLEPGKKGVIDIEVGSFFYEYNKKVESNEAQNE